MKLPLAAWRRVSILATGLAVFTAVCCERQGAPSQMPASPPASAPSSPQRVGGASLEPAALAKEAALVRDLHLGLDDLRKEIAEKGAVERRRERPAVPEKAADVLLQSRVTTRLWDDPTVPAGSIGVSVKEGHITLEGRVGSVEQIQRSLLAALMVSEVAGVTSKLSIEPDDGSGATQGAPGTRAK